ncbi:MAG TPA: long-chain-fatty-acid--CoA ligase [Gemmatimonadales bacterium]|jgi:acyl-CoA synthetase (AMP-forming)/AMP-acid ligase II
MSLWTILARARRLHPEQLAVVDGGRRLSYREVGLRVDALARHLQDRGLGAGDRFATLLPNGLACFDCYFAAAGLGAILVPLNTRLHPDELAFILGDSGTRALIADPCFGPLAAEVVARSPGVQTVISTGPTFPLSTLAGAEAYPDRDVASGFTAAQTPPDRVAHLYYTSGTTGRPKGVMLTHRNVWIHALAAVAELGLNQRDVWAHVAPMFHLADAWATFAITWVGGRHVMLSRFEAGAALELIEREHVTLTNLVPTMLNLMVKHPDSRRFDYRSLRLLLSGGAPIAPEVVRAIVETFDCEYVQTYGMTETSPYLTLSLLKEHLKALSPEAQLGYRAKTGRPFLAVELRVVDDGGREVAADERQVGEVQVRGETVTPGYWNRPDATAEAFTADGWLRTGDLAVIDDEGYVTIVDRKKDVIITGGEKVYSTEVEFVLYQHAAVLEAAVYGTPDPVWGEIVTAAVVARPGMLLSEEELVTFCRPRLAAFKLPRRVRFLPELPKTGSGKILKRALAR